MSLPERFVIVIEGTMAKVRTRALIVPKELPHLFTQLLAGNIAAADAMKAHGLRVSVEEDRDQGEE